MESLNKQKLLSNAQLARIITFLLNCQDHNQFDIEEFETRLTRLEEIWEQYKKVNHEIFQLCDDTTSVHALEFDEEFETKYISAKSKLTKIIKEKKATSDNSDSGTQKNKDSE